MRYHPSLWAACAICGPPLLQQVFNRLQWQIRAIEGRTALTAPQCEENGRVLIRKCLWFGEAKFTDIVDV